MSIRAIRNLYIGFLLATASLPAQTATQGPTFDVASIKLSEPITPQMVQAGRIHVGMKIDGSRVDIGNFSLVQLIAKAYDVKAYQIQGPSWMTPMAQRFDIVANLPAGANKDQIPQMLQALLAERFKLVMHKESKDQKIYAMVVGKDGHKMKQTAEAEPANPAVTGSSSVSINTSKGGAAEVSNGAGTRQRMVPSPDGKMMRFEISGATMSELGEGLIPFVDRPIVDYTELKGRYDLVLEIPMQELMNMARAAGANIPGGGGGAASSSAAPADNASEPGGSIFSALQAVGLKLDARKGPMPMIIVDSAEKVPTEN